MNIKIIARWITHASVILMIASCCTCDKAGSDEERALVLESVGTFGNADISESSGIVQSVYDPDLYWTHNDSGGSSTLYPVYADGTSESPAAITISDTVITVENIDWEDITMDHDTGTIYVGDIGNNPTTLEEFLLKQGFDRTNLCLYKFPEPNTIENVTSDVLNIPFQYSEYTPETQSDFDAEAIFWARGTVYLLTKHYFNTMTVLYRFNFLDGREVNPLELRGSFDCQGAVSGADASADGNRLVVLANVYTSSLTPSSSIIWLFEVSSGDDYFNGSVYRLRIDAGQCEAICFMDDVDDTLLITNEAGQLFKVQVNQLVQLK